jgi:hypothetical protein
MVSPEMDIHHMGESLCHGTGEKFLKYRAEFASGIGNGIHRCTHQNMPASLDLFEIARQGIGYGISTVLYGHGISDGNVCASADACKDAQAEKGCDENE